jgi:hypothetical protein
MTETCDATKNDGDPCEYEAKYDDGKCGIHTDEKDNIGRPSEVDKHKDDILVGARQGMTMAGLARLAGVDESTLHRYLDKDKNKKFRKSLKRARAQGELKHLQSVNDSGSRFVLERSFGYQKTEERELEDVTEGEGGFGTNIIVSGDYDPDDGDE